MPEEKSKTPYSELQEWFEANGSLIEKGELMNSMEQPASVNGIEFPPSNFPYPYSGVTYPYPFSEGQIAKLLGDPTNGGVVGFVPKMPWEYQPNIQTPNLIPQVAEKQREQTLDPFEGLVRELVKEWQARLRLDDWTFDIVVITETDPGLYGKVDYSLSDRFYRITVRHPDLHPPKHVSAACQDTEVTVVHELLHVRMWPFKYASEKPSEDSMMYDEMEAAIELTAQALVAAKRGQLRVV